MSDEETPASEKPISATEEFRRSWRNSLLWSMLAIVVGFGSAKSGVAFSMLGTGLAYNQRVVSGGAMLIAAFMFLVYLRARANDRRLNAESAVEASSAKLTDIIDMTVRDAEAARGAIGSAKSIAEYAEHNFEQEIIRYRAELPNPKNRDNAISELEQVSRAYKPPLMGPITADSNEVKREIYTRLTDRIKQLNLEHQQRVERGLQESEIVQIRVNTRKSELVDNVIEQISIFDESTKRIGMSAESLTKFYRGISRRERRWYAALDVWAVYLMLGAAIVVAGSRTLGYSPDKIFGVEAPTRLAKPNASR